MQITEATPQELDDALHVERAAFGHDDEAELVAALLRDPTAQPCLSLLARVDGAPVGHVLFTRVRLTGAARPVSASILAPLAVVPSWQRQGVGRALIEHAAGALARAGVELVFVLGDPAYYGRHGFAEALPLGLQAPHAIVPPQAWRVRALGAHRLGSVQGVVACAEALSPAEFWRE
jgi:putative acetyltransferase